MKRFKGFTLVEIAIILVILGLLIGLGASLIGPLVKRAKLTETREIVNAAVESVIGFAIKTGRLPNQTEFKSLTRNKDAWGLDLIYIPDDASIKHDGTTSRVDLTANTTYICNVTLPIDLAVNDKRFSGGANNYINDVAFIILSKGEDRALNTTNQTNVNTGNTTYTVFTINEYSSTYDDIVRYVTMSELITKIGCTGTPPPPSNCTSESPVNLITNDRIYYCFYDTDYSSECDDQNNACQELKPGESLSVNPGDKIRLYKKKKGNKCKAGDALTVNPGSKPCLGYNSGGVCSEIKPVDSNNNCQVQGAITGSNYNLTDK